MNMHAFFIGLTIALIGFLMLLPLLTVTLFKSFTDDPEITGQVIGEPEGKGAILGLTYAIIILGFAVIAISFFVNPRKPY